MSLLIEETRHISSKSITAVCHRAAELGVSYADLAEKSDDQVYLLFFPNKFQKETMYTPVNYEHIHAELKKIGVTLKLLWQEYRDGVGLPPVLNLRTAHDPIVKCFPTAD